MKLYYCAVSPGPCVAVFPVAFSEDLDSSAVLLCEAFEELPEPLLDEAAEDWSLEEPLFCEAEVVFFAEPLFCEAEAELFAEPLFCEAEVELFVPAEVDFELLFEVFDELSFADDAEVEDFLV